MATIIKSISFQNFYNYYGDYNEDTTYDFVEGINIINADNNMGKSKFYNGILWILNDKVYDSDTKTMTDVSSSYVKMASGKAKNKYKDFDMGVKVILKENDTLYELKKTVHFTKQGELWNTKDRFDVKKTIKGEDSFVYDIKEQEEILNKFIPSGLQNYALLQGETMERLVDLSSANGLYSTIKVLADIDLLNKSCKTITDLRKRAQSLENDKAKAASSKDEDRKDKIEEKSQKLAKIEETYQKIEEYKSELAKAEALKEKLEAMVIHSEERVRFKSEMDKAQDLIDRKKIEKSKMEKGVNSMLFNVECPWLLLGIDDEAKKFDKNRMELVGEILAKAKFHKMINLPLGSPDSGSLVRMLETCHCEICDRDFKKGDDSYKHIEYLKTRPHPEEKSSRNDLNDFFGGLATGATYMTGKANEISERIESYHDKIDSLEAEIKEAEEELERVRMKFIDAGGDESAMNTEMSNLSQHQLASKAIDDYKGKIKLAEDNINRWKDRIEQIDDLLDEGGFDEKIEKYKKFTKTIELIESVLYDTKEKIFKDLIDNLEKNTNKNYQKLTAGSQTTGGTIKFKKTGDNTVQVAIRDDRNGELTGLGTGFQRMKQLSIVMAIIESKLSNKHFDYPFISDAPFSEFGEQFMHNFFDVAPGVFTQSIILIKDLYDPDPNSKTHIKPLGLKVLDKMKNGDIQGSFYVNVIEEKADTSNLRTSHKRYY